MLQALAPGAQQAAVPGVIVSGTVRDPAGMPIPGARVTVFKVDETQPVNTAASSAWGEFSFALTAGRYRLVVSAGGFQEDTRALEAGAEPLQLDIRLQLEDQRAMVTVTESAGYQALIPSATRTPTPLIDVPQAISVVTRDLIRDQSMQNMADVVRYVPGITMAQGEGHRDAPVIRGNVTTSDFYVNGVRDDVQYLRDLYNVERVEAVKGANALTFGRGGGGGVINRVTKEAGFSPVREIALQGGTFNNRRATTDLGHTFGERAALRVNGLYENSDGFRHAFGLERYGIAPSLMVKPTASTQLRFNYERFYDGRTVDRGIPSFRGGPAPAHRSTFFGDPEASRATASIHLGSAVVEHQVGAWNLRNATVAGDYDKFYRNVFPGAVRSDLATVSISGYDNSTIRRNVFNQTDATGVWRTGRLRHTILMGAEFGRQRSVNFRNTAYFGSATAIAVPFLYPNVRTSPLFRQAASDADNIPWAGVAAVFVQDQIEVSRHVQLVAGVRFDRFRIEFRDNRDRSELSRSDRMGSPRLGLVVKPVDRVSLYSSYSVSYLPGSGEQFASLTATTQTLQPQKFTNYEIGAKMDLRRGLSVTTALYRLDLTNTTARDPNNPARVVQTGSQRTNGYELGLNGSVTRRWQVSGGYATQDAFIRTDTTAAPRGSKVALVPSHTVSLWNHYRITGPWGMGLGLIRQSPMYAGIDNTVSLPAFTRADVATFYSITEAVRLQANLENAFDRTYYATAHSNNNILPGSARALRVGLVARF
jgi:catecholate siderophore receptor